jgi:hypothetical protein
VASLLEFLCLLATDIMAQFQNCWCVICELTHVKRQMQHCNQGILEAQKELGMSTLRLSHWHEMWEKNLLSKAKERDPHMVPVVVQIQTLKERKWRESPPTSLRPQILGVRHEVGIGCYFD